MLYDGGAGESEVTTEMAATEPEVDRRVTLVIAILLGATFVMILNETVMGIALPHIMGAFGVAAATAQWLTTVFLLTMAVVIPATGFVLDRYPTRNVFVAAMSVFTLGTATAAAAPAFGILLVGRVLQACGTAVILPLLMTTIMTFVPESRRGRTMGFVSIVIAVAPAIGPAFSGLVLSFAPWRFVYIAVLPFSLCALIVGARLVVNLAEPKHSRFDAVSFALSIVAFGGLVYGLASVGEAAESHVWIPPIVPVVVGLVGAVLFVWRQVRLQQGGIAFLDLRPFASRSFSLCLVILLFAMGALFGALILLPLYMQQVLHLGSLTSGLMLLPGGLVMGLVAPGVGRLYDRYGPQPLVLPASVVLLGSVVMLRMVNQGTSPVFIVGAHMVLSLALGMLFTPCITFALSSVTDDLVNHASAILNALQQLCGAAGTALFITVMTKSELGYVRDGLPADAALGRGIHTAFICGIVLTGLMIVASLFVRGRPTSVPSDVLVH
jgi:DHA2 family lincomycin resistance protein-like MFS transporter